jgi:PAS domain S-box-containing protein
MNKLRSEQKILAIDDNPKLLFFLEKLIKTYFPEAEYLRAESGLQGMELAIDNLPNVILLDILMPQPDGFEICEKLKANEITQDIPVIFLSGLENNQENRLKAIEAGADAFLAKPVNNLELMLQIRTMLKINSANLKKRNEKKYLAEQVDLHSKKLKDELARRMEAEKALKESEQRYRFLIENQNDLVVQFNPNNELTFVSPNYCKSFGVSESEFLGKTFFSIIHEDDIEHVKESIRSLKNPPHKSYHEERAKTVIGWRWFGWSLKANVDDNQQIIDTVAVGRDITKRKETEQQLKRQEEELRDLNATKDKFFSIIGHDLKGPFNGIMGLSQMIYELCENEQYDNLQNMTALLNKAATQSYELLNNLLEWSRMQSGRKKIELQSLNLCNAISDTINLVSISAHHKNIRITSNCDLDIQINADPDVLNTIIRNLLNNAVKYSHNGGEITISALQRDNDVVVSVKDEGLGIAPELQTKLFKIGEVVVKPGTNKEKGTGWGLILCKEFIELHGGKIWFDSEPGSGATFYFNIPINK